MEKEKNQRTMEQEVKNVKKPLLKRKGFWAGVITVIALVAGGSYVYKRHNTAKSSKGETTPDTPRQEDFRNDRGNRDFRRHGERNNSNSN